MDTKWIGRLTVLTLAICLMLILLGVYLVVTQGRDLTAARAELARTKQETAVRNSGLMYLNASIRETNHFFANVKNLLLSVCPRAEGAQRRQPCDQLGQQADIIAVFSLAASNRAAAQTREQYREVAGNYAQALRFLESYPDFPDRDRLRAFAHEGMAYARYRQHDLAAAAAAIREARRFNPASLLVGLTEIKIHCAERTDPQNVRAKLNALRNGEPSDGGEERARVVDQDMELRLVCAYALE